MAPAIIQFLGTWAYLEHMTAISQILEMAGYPKGSYAMTMASSPILYLKNGLNGETLKELNSYDGVFAGIQEDD